MHIKSKYGDNGTLKVSMTKVGREFNVVVKSKQRSKEWQTISHYQTGSRKKANALFRKIYDEF